MLHRYKIALLASAYAMIALPAYAMPFHLVFERETNVGSGQEVVVATVPTFADLVDWNPASTEFSTLDVAGVFSTTGLAYDGSLYYLMFERDTNVGSGQELAFATFDTIDDIIDYNPITTQFSTIDVAGVFSTTGLAYDGELFHLMFERDTNVGSGQEVAFARFSSFADLIDYNPIDTQFSTLDVAGVFSTTGLAHDGELFHIMFERETNVGSGQEVAFSSVASFADLIDYNPIATQFSTLDVAGVFSTTGLSAFVDYDMEPPVKTPEPGALALLAMGLVALGVSRLKDNS